MLQTFACILKVAMPTKTEPIISITLYMHLSYEHVNLYIDVIDLKAQYDIKISMVAIILTKN